MAAYDSTFGKYLTCAAIFRGLLSSKEIEEAMVEVQACNSDLFVKWIPNNIKTAICDIPPRGLPTAATFLANTTAVTVIFERLISQFDAMFCKRAFVHWYTGEGMDEQEFSDAKNVVVDLCEEYIETSCETEDDDTCAPDSFLTDFDDDGCSVCSECEDPKCTCECIIDIKFAE